MKQGCRATLGNMLLSFPTMVLVASVSCLCGKERCSLLHQYVLLTNLFAFF